MKIKSVVYLLAVAAIWSGLMSCDEDETNIDSQDLNFINETARLNQTTIEFSEIAIAQSTSPVIVNYNRQLAEAYRSFQTELIEIADRKDISLTAKLSDYHEEVKAQLNTLSGYQFDSAYMNIQVTNNNLVESLHVNEISGGKEQEVRMYAEKYLPDIRNHARQGENIRNLLGQ